eukprot:GHVU01054702.1.p1 GENE.GHVU01054702.1~~GHVU01054702.1.p1  ORF type:complete len:139 (+),score=6.61 GHVU01054702.1:176-592(+)
MLAPHASNEAGRVSCVYMFPGGRSGGCTAGVVYITEVENGVFQCFPPVHRCHRCARRSSLAQQTRTLCDRQVVDRRVNALSILEFNYARITHQIDTSTGKPSIGTATAGADAKKPQHTHKSNSVKRLIEKVASGMRPA